MTDLIAPGVIAVLTSTLTAVTGIGGGSLLIASMPGFLPNAAIIPVHAIVQLFSNLSRALFAYKNVCWNYVIGFLAGSVLGGHVVRPDRYLCITYGDIAYGEDHSVRPSRVLIRSILGFDTLHGNGHDSRFVIWDTRPVLSTELELSVRLEDYFDSIGDSIDSNYTILSVEPSV